jgi:hypothetical protein
MATQDTAAPSVLLDRDESTLALAASPSHAVTSFTVNSTNDGTNIMPAGAEEASA